LAGEGHSSAAKGYIGSLERKISFMVVGQNGRKHEAGLGNVISTKDQCLWSGQ